MPRSVVVGSVNTPAILIFLAQVPNLIGLPWQVYPLLVGGPVLMVRGSRTCRSPSSSTTSPTPATAAPVAVMVLVAFGTFDWDSVRPATLTRMPAGESAVMWTVPGAARR